MSEDLNEVSTTVGGNAVLIDLQVLSQLAYQRGAQWGCASDDLNLTLLAWPYGHLVAPHVNNEVDVVFLAISGEGEVTVDEETFTLVPGEVLLIPKGTERSVRSTSECFSYLSLHRRRGGLRLDGGSPAAP